MAIFTSNFDFNNTTVAPPAGVARVGNTSRVYTDNSNTIPNDGITISGDRVTLLTPSARGAGTWNFTNSTMWMQGTSGNAQDFDRGNAAQFTWTDGQINYGGFPTNAAGGPFIRMRDQAHTLVLTNTTLTNTNYDSTSRTNYTAGLPVGSGIAQPGLNIARLDIPSSDIQALP